MTPGDRNGKLFSAILVSYNTPRLVGLKEHVQATGYQSDARRAWRHHAAFAGYWVTPKSGPVQHLLIDH